MFRFGWLVIVVFAVSLVGCVQGTTLVRPDGSSVSTSDLPMIGQHAKLPGYLAQHSEKRIGLAATPKNCPSSYAISWEGYDPYARSLNRCYGFIRNLLADYSAETLKKCDCVPVVRDHMILREDILLREKKIAPIKIYTKQKDGPITPIRGFLEFERDEVTRQKSRILNEKFEEICRGELNFSLGQGGFELSCFAGSVIAKGVLTMNDVATGFHAIGSGALDTGEVFAFITRLTDKEIDARYPGFPGKNQ